MARFTDIDSNNKQLPPVDGHLTSPIVSLRRALEPFLSQIEKLSMYMKLAKEKCHSPSEHGLTRDESAAIFLYTAEWGDESLCRVLNQALRSKDRSVLQPWFAYLKLFDSALQKLPIVRGKVWCGVPGDISKNFKDGDELTWWTIHSCSPKVNVIKNMLGPKATLFMIEALNAKNVSGYTKSLGDEEVILGLGSHFRVVSNASVHSHLPVVHLRELSNKNEQPPSSSVAAMHMTQAATSTKGKEYGHAVTDKRSSTSQIHTDANGDKYDGEWINEKKHGRGTMTCADGCKYTGDWIDDYATGQGVLVWQNGDRYKGQFKDDKKNGQGTYYFANKEKYAGDWLDDRMSGQGVYTWPDGERYEGQYKDDQKNGRGTYDFANGEKYTGDWIDDKRTGEGVYIWPSGSRYQGQFKDSKKNGRGEMRYADGQVKEGMWSDDVFVS